MAELFRVVIPLFSIILCGFLAGRLSIISFNSTTALNNFVYYFSLPALLFLSISTAPVEQLLNWNFILLNICIISTMYVFSILIFRFIFKKNFPELSLYGMITTYGNTGFLGIPLLITAFGQSAAIPAAIINFVYDVLIISFIIITFELAKIRKNKQQNGPTHLLRLIVRSIFFNPINASLLLGVLIALNTIPVPQPIYVFTEILSPAAGPTALFALGLGLSGERNVLKNENYQLAELITLVGLKLIVLPLLALFYIYFVFQPENAMWAKSVILLSAVPTGALVYVFAKKYNTMAKQVPLYILVTTVLSIFTIAFVLIFL
ncbi:AEC family transporter [Gracilibacillus massiliensis]|uniref:AEC family transporter n=1 Tax=Gracilibacillus massiliensis TaxID=1564956 RepID=UPI00071D920A|nr:AEC family transporter [Gracilibacillus massiliensis]